MKIHFGSKIFFCHILHILRSIFFFFKNQFKYHVSGWLCMTRFIIYTNSQYTTLPSPPLVLPHILWYSSHLRSENKLLLTFIILRIRSIFLQRNKLFPFWVISVQRYPLIISTEAHTHIIIYSHTYTHNPTSYLNFHNIFLYSRTQMQSPVVSVSTSLTQKKKSHNPHDNTHELRPAQLVLEASIGVIIFGFL